MDTTKITPSAILHTCPVCGAASASHFCHRCKAMIKEPPRFPLRVPHSVCDDVYLGEEHLAIIEDRECGLIVADIETWVDERAARAMTAGPELLDHLRSVVEMAHSVSAKWESGDLAHAVRSLERIATNTESVIERAS